MASQLLSKLRAQRDATLERLAAVLMADERCVAAWLFGSIGRGEEDALSDIDVWIAVRDSDCAEVVADRRSFVAQIGEPIHILEAPQNAPSGGGYLLAFYAGEAGLQHIDWYWQPQSSAKIPQNVRLLFDRADLPHSGLPPLVMEKEADSAEYRLREAQNRVIFFWSMAPIAAKCIARRKLWKALEMLSMLRGTLESVARFLNAAPPAILQASPPDAPEAQLALLQEMAHSVLNLHEALEAQGGESPAAVAPSVFEYFSLVEKLLKETA